MILFVFEHVVGGTPVWEPFNKDLMGLEALDLLHFEVYALIVVLDSFSVHVELIDKAGVESVEAHLDVGQARRRQRLKPLQDLFDFLNSFLALVTVDVLQLVDSTTLF